MGTKAIDKDMIKLIDEITNDFQIWNGKVYTGKIPKTEYTEQAAAYHKTMKDKVDRLLQYSYSEARTEEIIKQIIEQCKADLIKLIQANEKFGRDQRPALEILQAIKGLYSQIPHGTMSDIVDYLYNLRKLLTKRADIADAVQVISQDLEKLMQTLRKAET